MRHRLRGAEINTLAPLLIKNSIYIESKLGILHGITSNELVTTSKIRFDIISIYFDITTCGSVAFEGGASMVVHV